MKTHSSPSDRTTLDFAALGIDEVPLVGRYTYTRAHPPLRRHSHGDAFEVCLLQHGTQAYRVGSRRHELSAGDMIVTRPGEVHGTDNEPENRGRLYWIQFKRPAGRRPFLGLSFPAARALFETLARQDQHVFHNCNALAATFERILDHDKTSLPRPLLKASAQNLLVRLLLDILSLTGRDTHHACSPMVRRALDHLAQQVADHVTLARLAAAAGASESYLKAHFAREVGMTPMEYHMWLRIEQAKRLLRETRTPITELCFDLGFATSQHFATAFKRFAGHTPRDFRQLSPQPQPEEPPQAGAGPKFHPVSAARQRPRRALLCAPAPRPLACTPLASQPAARVSQLRKSQR